MKMTMRRMLMAMVNNNKEKKQKPKLENSIADMRADDKENEGDDKNDSDDDAVLRCLIHRSTDDVASKQHPHSPTLK